MAQITLSSKILPLYSIRNITTFMLQYYLKFQLRYLRHSLIYCILVIISKITYFEYCIFLNSIKIISRCTITKDFEIMSKISYFEYCIFLKGEQMEIKTEWRTDGDTGNNHYLHIINNNNCFQTIIIGNVRQNLNTNNIEVYLNFSNHSKFITIVSSVDDGKVVIENMWRSV